MLQIIVNQVLRSKRLQVNHGKHKTSTNTILFQHGLRYRYISHNGSDVTSAASSDQSKLSIQIHSTQYVLNNNSNVEIRKDSSFGKKGYLKYLQRMILRMTLQMNVKQTETKMTSEKLGVVMNQIANSKFFMNLIRPKRSPNDIITKSSLWEIQANSNTLFYVICSDLKGNESTMSSDQNSEANVGSSQRLDFCDAFFICQLFLWLR